MADQFKQDILDDSGWKSRKVWLSILAIGVLGWGYWVSQFNPLFQGLYPTFGGFILGVLATYFGANAGHSYIASKTPDAPAPVEPPIVPPGV
jgi:hypothetical protein